MNCKKYSTDANTVLTNKAFFILILITFIIHLPPPFMYGVARFTGALPSKAEWATMPGKGGPWLDTPQGYFFIFAFLAMVALPFITFTFCLGLSLAAEHRKLSVFISGIALTGLQVALGYIFLMSFFWVID